MQFFVINTVYKKSRESKKSRYERILYKTITLLLFVNIFIYLLLYPHWGLSPPKMKILESPLGGGDEETKEH